MPFSEAERKKIDNFVGGLCRKRSPAHLKDKLSLEYRVKGHEVVVFERRPRWDNASVSIESPVAKLKYVRTVNEWRLFWQRADLRWHGYQPLPASRELGDLIEEIDQDPCACFFG
jgi:hypothetical protein